MRPELPVAPQMQTAGIRVDWPDRAMAALATAVLIGAPALILLFP